MKEPNPLEWVLVLYDEKWYNPVGSDGVVFTGCTSYHYARKKLEKLDYFNKAFFKAKYCYPIVRGMWKSMPQDKIDNNAKNLGLTVDAYLSNVNRGLFA